MCTKLAVQIKNEQAADALEITEIVEHSMRLENILLYKYLNTQHLKYV
jgi:hypothetical protein